MKKKRFIVTISHSNYTLYSAGTEKLIKDLEKVYIKNGVEYLQFFPLKKLSKNVGLNINGFYNGIYNIEQMKNIVSAYTNKGYILEGIIIQHVRGFNLQMLKEELLKINSKIVLCIHDFYFICNTFNFMKNGNEFCGITKPTQKKCKDCHNYNLVFNFTREINDFLKDLNPLIEKVIFPSEFCKNEWLKFFPMYIDRENVRPLLKYTGNYSKTTNRKLRIAYVGRKNKYKGVDAWNKLLANEHLIKKYDFYYFGKDIDAMELKNTKVKNILVDGVRDKKGMTYYLRKHNIDIAFLWSIIPETYSYTYYESSSAGAIVFTNHNSGNIAKQTEINKNGIVFSNDKELFNFLNDEKIVKKKVIEVKTNFTPEQLLINDDVSCYKVSYNQNMNMSFSKIKKKRLISLLYYFKNVRNKNEKGWNYNFMWKQ